MANNTTPEQERNELFVNVRKRAKEDKNLNETLARIFHNIENSAKGFDSENATKGFDLVGVII